VASWDDDYYVPQDWSDAEAQIYDRMVSGDAEIGNDQHLQGLYDAAFFDNIHGNGGPEHDFLVDALRDYLLDRYDIEFDDVFDWEAWRDWYDSL
jgi:hypothetical protein